MMGGGCSTNAGRTGPVCVQVCLNSMNPSPARAEKCARLAASPGRHGNVSGDNRGRSWLSDLSLSSCVCLGVSMRAGSRLIPPCHQWRIITGRSERERRGGGAAEASEETGWDAEPPLGLTTQLRCSDGLREEDTRPGRGGWGDQSCTPKRTGDDLLGVDHGTVWSAEHQARLSESSLLDPSPVHRSHSGVVLLRLCPAALHR